MPIHNTSEADARMLVQRLGQDVYAAVTKALLDGPLRPSQVGAIASTLAQQARQEVTTYLAPPPSNSFADDDFAGKRCRD